MLVQGHYLRKKYKDPDHERRLRADRCRRRAGQPGPASPASRTTRPGRTGQPGRRPVRAGRPPSSGSSRRVPAVADLVSRRRGCGGTVPGGMMGVRSKSKDESIRLYLGRNHYNEWMFVFYVRQQQPRRSARRPGWSAAAAGGPGGPEDPDSAAVGPGRPGGPGRVAGRRARWRIPGGPRRRSSGRGGPPGSGRVGGRRQSAASSSVSDVIAGQDVCSRAAAVVRLCRLRSWLPQTASTIASCTARRTGWI